jgi:Protein of unknown function (DUF5818)
MKWCPLLIAGIMLCAALACAQEGPSPDPVFSSDLIAWSGMQQPQAPEQRPGNQSSSPANQPQPQSDANSTDSQNADSHNQVPTASSFTGTISQEAGGFVLKVSNKTSYKLDAQRQVEQYDGQRVRVTGTLETGVNVIHVDRIEPLS